MDASNVLTVKLTMAEEEKGRLLNDISRLEKKIEDLQRRMKDVEGSRDRLESANEQLKKERNELQERIEETQKAISTKDILGKLKQEEEDKLKKEQRALNLSLQ